MIISYFLSFSYNRTMQIWKQKKKERMSLRLGLDLWWPNWLRRSLIIKRKGRACKERLGHNSSNSYSLHEIHEEIEDEKKQITRYWRKEKKKEAPGPYYNGTHTYVLTSTHKRKEAAPQSCPILTPLWTCSMFLDFHPILMLNPMCG